MQLLAYGDGQVIPNTLQTIQPNLKYSIVVALSTEVQYGRVILVMDKGFCTDRAGNRFIRPQNSSFIVHFGEYFLDKIVLLSGIPYFLEIHRTND